MSRAALSLFVFGIYVSLTGLVFLTVPETLIRVLQLPPTGAGWPRIVGFLALVIGIYDIVSARAGFVIYIKASVPLRFVFAAGITLLVVTGQMPATLIPLVVLEAAGAVWTAIALRSA